MPAELDRLRAAIEAIDASAPGDWTIEPHGDAEALFAGQVGADKGGILGACHGYNLVHLTDPAWQWPQARALICALRNVAPELLGCAIVLATIREDALADLAHYRARATGGQVARLPHFTASQAARIERETRCLDALDARIREAVPEETGE